MLTAPEQEELTTLLLQDWNELNNSESAPVDWEQMVQQILSESKTKPVHRIHFLKTTWFKYAAAILIILSTVAYLWNTQKEKGNPSVSHTNPVPMQSDVAPGGNKATLTLADGTIINLDSSRVGEIAHQGSTNITKTDDGIIAYEISRTREDASWGERPVQRPNDPVIPSERSEARNLVFNTLSTPRGGQYQLTLPDGSKVWLNAASSITYPTAFTSTERNVTIKGEVYFEVAKNKKPFIVNIDDKATVEVLGTHFNVNAYAEENKIHTTLIEGSVRMKTQNKTLVLKPNQQAELTNQQLILTENANIRQVTAWKNGLFILSNTSVPTIMRQISRWYDVEVKYEGTIPAKKLGGGISRNLPLSEILDLLKNYGVQFRLEGKTLYVRP